MYRRKTGGEEKPYKLTRNNNYFGKHPMSVFAMVQWSNGFNEVTIGGVIVLPPHNWWEKMGWWNHCSSKRMPSNHFRSRRTRQVTCKVRSYILWFGPNQKYSAAHARVLNNWYDIMLHYKTFTFVLKKSMKFVHHHKF